VDDEDDQTPNRRLVGDKTCSCDSAPRAGGSIDRAGRARGEETATTHFEVFIRLFLTASTLQKLKKLHGI